MPKIRLTYWWNGHQPGDIVEVDDVTARTLLGTIAVAVADERDPQPRKRPEKQGE
jgi:hypothetical protein